VARTPVLVKLTPNISDIRVIARAAKRGGADGLSAINTINSITGIDLDTLTPRPNVDGNSLARRLLRAGGETHRAAHGAAARERPRGGLPISGIGGIGWREAPSSSCSVAERCKSAPP
jgi:dihydropyrimidine dehydrogenase (NAD+) subunit PreA